MNNLVLFTFDTTSVRAVDREGLAWFVAVDVCAALGITSHHDAVARLDPDERGSVEADTPGGRQSVAAISEAAAELLAEVDERYRRGVVRRGTVLNYGEAFRIWIVPYLGDRVLTEIETTDIEDPIVVIRHRQLLSQYLPLVQLVFPLFLSP